MNVAASRVIVDGSLGMIAMALFPMLLQRPLPHMQLLLPDSPLPLLMAPISARKASTPKAFALGCLAPMDFLLLFRYPLL